MTFRKVKNLTNLRLTELIVIKSFFVQLYAVILLSSNRSLSDIYTSDFSVQFHQKIYFFGKAEWVWLWIAYWPLRFKHQNWTFEIWRVNVSFRSSDETFFWSHFRRKKTFFGAFYYFFVFARGQCYKTNTVVIYCHFRLNYYRNIYNIKFTLEWR
jgi:hypothetical protein